MSSCLNEQTTSSLNQKHSSGWALLTNTLMTNATLPNTFGNVTLILLGPKDLNASLQLFSGKGKHIQKKTSMPKLTSAFPFSNKSPR